MRMDLPHRRYSMPETIMRKFRLGQYSGSSSSENGSIKGGQGRRKPLTRRRYQSRVHRSAQTSPQVIALTDENSSTQPILMESSPALTTRPTRASSVPDLSSSEETDATPYNRKLIKLRPMSLSDALGGTPSPSCYGGPEHACPLCSASWRYSSSDYTLSQTVSDRTTSTQDSTLSVQSTTPSVSTPLPFEPLAVERCIFSPAGNYIAVHTESILIRPISVVDTADNWHFGFTPDDIETQMTMLPQSVGTITEDDIEAITSGRKHRSTSINGWAELEQGDEGVNPLKIELGENKAVQVYTGKTIACQTDVPKGVTFESEKCFETVKLVDREAGPSVPIFRTSKSFPPCEPRKSIMKRVKADVAVSGGNYKEYERAKDLTIARYSAVPRSNSMLVNTSSVDYTSDSDLSLTDSLEDGEEGKGRRENWPQTRHDSRLVRGEVSVEADPRARKRYPKGGDAYAYFLSFSGEQDIIREHSIPDWLRERLKRREEEIKKLFEVKLNKHQTIIYRRRKKTVKHLQYESNSSNNVNKKRRAANAVSWYDQGGKDNRDVKTIEGIVEQKGEGTLQVSPNNPIAMPSTSRDQPQALDNNNYVHISEVIKIELSDKLKTVITKEKQINLNNEAFLRQGKHIQSSEIINNENDKHIQKVELKTHVGSLQQEDKPQEETKQKKPLIAKKKESPYSFRQFRPLFESKADDQTVAGVLLAAMNDNESSQMKVSVELQTGEEEVTVEKSCNTDQPYASEGCQTVDSYCESSCQTAFKVDKGEQSDARPTVIVTTVNRASNTVTFSVSTVVQTKESFLEEDTVVSELFVEKGTDAFEEAVNNDKCVQTMNPLVSTEVQTNPVEETECEKPPITQPKKTAPEKSSKLHDGSNRGFPSDKSKDPQVLELNVPPCSCHMCTFHKKSVACERQKDGQTKTKAQPSRRFEPKEKKQGARFLPGRKPNVPTGNKFQRKFEAIPEERGSPTESLNDDLTPRSEEPQKREAVVQTTRDDTTQTMALESPESSRHKKKPNLVIGRFRAIPEVPGSSRDQAPTGIELVRQYKGRAALATAQVECQEELLTLSKGWINFYLLKDSQDHSDSNNDEDWAQNCFQEKVEQYCVEIQATPETAPCQDASTATGSRSKRTRKPIDPNSESTLILPDLPQREIKRRHRHQTKHQQSNALPEIHSSSSSSTPDVQTEVNHQFQYNQATSVRKHQLPDVNSYKRTNRHEIKTRKEQVTTAVEKTTKSEPRIRLPPDMDAKYDAFATKAVEVARSEHSVSSITSSTVIMSESPSPQQLINHENGFRNSEQNGGSSWTVTVAGSSGMVNQSPPDVEMKLTFPKQANGVVKRLENGERSLMQYNSHQTHISRSKRQGKMIEAYAHSQRNEQHSLHYVPDIHYNRVNRHNKRDRESNRSVAEDFQTELDLSARSRGSLDLLSEGLSDRGGGDLLVTGSAITPEIKPRVPTQSERDLVRRPRIKVPR